MISDGHLEDLRNHFDDGYGLGKEDGYELGKEAERNRIMAWFELDLLIPDNVKIRVLDLIRGGKLD
jgi:hypothetical protein